MIIQQYSAHSCSCISYHPIIHLLTSMKPQSSGRAVDAVQSTAVSKPRHTPVNGIIFLLLVSLGHLKKNTAFLQKC